MLFLKADCKDKITQFLHQFFSELFYSHPTFSATFFTKNYRFFKAGCKDKRILLADKLFFEFNCEGN